MASEDEHLERLARKLCSAAGVDPDADVVREPFVRVKDGYSMMPDYSVKAWTIWFPEAKAAAEFYREGIQELLDANAFGSFFGLKKYQ